MMVGLGLGLGSGTLTEFVEALSCLADFPAAPLELPLQPLTEVQDPDDPPQQVTRPLEDKTHTSDQFIY